MVSSKGTISLPGDHLAFPNETSPPSRRPFGLPQRGAAFLEETIWPSPTRRRLFSDTVWVIREGSRDLRRVFRCLFGLFSARLPVLRGFAERIDGPKRSDGGDGRQIFSVYRSEQASALLATPEAIVARYPAPAPAQAAETPEALPPVAETSGG